jgi:WD40 repeat protein
LSSLHLTAGVCQLSWESRLGLLSACLTTGTIIMLCWDVEERKLVYRAETNYHLKRISSLTYFSPHFQLLACSESGMFCRVSVPDSMLTLSFSQAAVNFTSVEFDDSQQIAVLGTDKANILFFDMSGPKPLLLQSLHVADGKEKGKGVKVRSLTLDPTSRRLYLTIGAALYVMPMPEKSHLTNKYVTGQLDPHKNGVTCLIAPKQSTLSAMTETLKIKAMMLNGNTQTITTTIQPQLLHPPLPLLLLLLPLPPLPLPPLPLVIMCVLCSS